jgi:hypothetical protein
VNANDYMAIIELWVVLKRNLEPGGVHPGEIAKHLGDPKVKWL